MSWRLHLCFVEGPIGLLHDSDRCNHSRIVEAVVHREDMQTFLNAVDAGREANVNDIIGKRLSDAAAKLAELADAGGVR